MYDEDEHCSVLESARTPRHLRLSLQKEQKQCALAIRSVDEPNVHRLLEMAHTTLPMIAHVSRIAELVTEKAYQRLKRAISQSNNRDIQIQC